MTKERGNRAGGRRPKWESDPIIERVPSEPVTAPAKVAIELEPGQPLPPILQISANPYSAGLYPLGRRYTVGDTATFRETDILTGLEKRIYTLRVTRVDEEADRIEINNGDQVWDTMGNHLKTERSVFDVPQQFSPAELQVGKKWTAAFAGTTGRKVRYVSVDFQIVSRELVTVPLGSLYAFRVEGVGMNRRNGNTIEERLWLVPRLNFFVRRERMSRNSRGGLATTVRQELVAVRQQAISL